MIAQIDTQYLKTKPLKGITRLIGYTFFEGRPITTKGRWINPFVFALLDIEKKLPQLKKVKSPIFIVGIGRSGTTVLGKILSMHRHVGFLNEPKAIWHSIYPQEDVIGNYSEGKAQFHLKAKDANDNVVTTAHRLFGAYLLFSFSTRLLVKYPENIFRISFVKKLFPDARFLFIVRNGWNNCFSIKRWSERYEVKMENEIHNWWGVNNRKWNFIKEQLILNNTAFREIMPIVTSFRENVDKAAAEWVVTMQEGLRQMRTYPKSILKVKFEDLTCSPQKTLTEIMQFCDLPKEKKINFYADRIVKKVKNYPIPDIHPAICPLIEKTNIMLGY